MHAMLVRQHGDPNVLELVEIPIPTPTGELVLVQHKAIGANFVDTQHRRGTPYPIALPLIPGVEAAGVVAALGPDVTEFAAGDRVAFAGHMSGVYAEYSLVPQARLVPIPDTVDFHQAAATLMQGMTAHALTESVYPIQQHDNVLIHAAASGVGLYLVQLAKRRGARVIGTTSSEAKAQVAYQAGADDVILYTQADFEAETRRLTQGAGVHVVYDGIGQATFDKGLRLLRPQGHMVVYGLSSGAVPPFDINRLSGITGSEERGSLFLTWPTLNDYAARREDLLWRARDILTWVADGILTPYISGRFPLAEAAHVHQLLESRQGTGKLLLEP
ncbi:MAG: quinone oxidoreductase [Kouleothrix sp.]|nr:quinone oxidoreductase [Kouleothrix sp.]